MEDSTLLLSSYLNNHIYCFVKKDEIVLMPND